MRILRVLLLALALANIAVAGEDSVYRRIPFSIKIELLDEAPGVAANATQAAFASKKSIHVVDTATGTDKEFPLPPEIADSDVEVYAAGIDSEAVHAVAIHFLNPDRPKPGDRSAQIGGGNPTSPWTVFSISTKDGAYTKRFELTNATYIADDMLGDSLVYAVGRELHIRHISGAEPEKIHPLDDVPKRVPAVSNGTIFGVGAASVYWVDADKSFHRLLTAGTPLAVLSDPDVPVTKCGDVILVPSAEGIVACDLSGKVRWKQAIYGHPVAGPGGEIYLNMGSGAARLAPVDGHLIWGRYLIPDNFNRTRGALAMDGKLVLISEHFVSVLDGITGQPVTGFPIDGKLVRTHYRVGTDILKSAAAKNVAVIGYEDRVYGIDLTATAAVPANQRAGDIANAEAMLAEFEKAPQAFKRDQLVQLGFNLSDTSALGARALPLVKPMLKTGDVLRAWQWLDDPAIAETILANQQELRSYGVDQTIMMVAFHPNRKLAESTLNKFIEDKATTTEFRDCATRFRALMSPPAKLSKADLDIVYSDDKVAMLKYFTSALTSGDATLRAHASDLLKLAPDSVIADLESTTPQIPDAPLRGEIESMVKKSKAAMVEAERNK